MARASLSQVVLTSAIILILNSACASANSPPVAVIAAPVDGTFFLDTELVPLSAEGTHDPDGGELNYTWKLNGAPVAYGVHANLSLSAGTYNITLVVRDEAEAEGNASVEVRVEEWIQPQPEGPEVSPELTFVVAFFFIIALLGVVYRVWRWRRDKYGYDPSWTEYYNE